MKYLLINLVLALGITSCQKEDTKPIDKSEANPVHLTLGNPSNATADVNNFNNYLLEKKQYTLSYNKEKAIPNWVSWYVSKDWLGIVNAHNDFRADYTLPTEWFKVDADTYYWNDFDMAQNCPAEDRTKLPEDNSATFLMTNVIPLAPNHNIGLWAELEKIARNLPNK